jgi:hypothetical protein
MPSRSGSITESIRSSAVMRSFRRRITWHHLADPAFAARLLDVSATALLAGKPGNPGIRREGTLLGALFESLVTQSVRVYAQVAEARVSHLRTHRGTTRST